MAITIAREMANGSVKPSSQSSRNTPVLEEFGLFAFFFCSLGNHISWSVMGYFSKGMIGFWLVLNASGVGLRNRSSLFIRCCQKVEVTLGLGILILPRRRKDQARLKL